MENNSCIHIFECADYPDKCNQCKGKKKSYFEPADERGVIPMHISPIDQYRFVWGEEPNFGNDYSLMRLISIADGIIPGHNKFI